MPSVHSTLGLSAIYAWRAYRHRSSLDLAMRMWDWQSETQVVALDVERRFKSHGHISIASICDGGTLITMRSRVNH